MVEAAVILRAAAKEQHHTSLCRCYMYHCSAFPRPRRCADALPWIMYICCTAKLSAFTALQDDGSLQDIHYLPYLPRRIGNVCPLSCLVYLCVAMSLAITLTVAALVNTWQLPGNLDLSEERAHGKPNPALCKQVFIPIHQEENNSFYPTLRRNAAAKTSFLGNPATPPKPPYVRSIARMDLRAAHEQRKCN